MNGITFKLFLLFFAFGLFPHLQAQEKTSKPKLFINALDSSATSLAKERSKFARFLRKKYAFADSVANLMANPGIQSLQFQIRSNPLWNFEQKPIIPALHYPSWENDLRKRAQGGYEQVSINPAQLVSAFQDKKEWEKGKKFRNHSIPSNLQLDVLSLLWQDQTGTQMDIYSNLDPSIPITAEGLDQQLERMVDQGLLERKMISPQNQFTILTPLKAFQVEMSAKNRRNRVYLYRTEIDKRDILQLILHRYYQVKNEGAGTPDEIERLNEKLKIILSNGDTG